MPCPAPECHEEMKIQIKDKVPREDFNELKTNVLGKLSKKSIWAAIPTLIIIFGIGIGAADYKYAVKDDVESCKRDQAVMKESLDNMSQDIQELKNIVTKGQNNTQKDVREIKDMLINLRDRK